MQKKTILKTCDNCLLEYSINSVLCKKYHSLKFEIMSSNIPTYSKIKKILSLVCPFWGSKDKIKNKPKADLNEFDVKIEINKLVAHYN